MKFKCHSKENKKRGERKVKRIVMKERRDGQGSMILSTILTLDYLFLLMKKQHQKWFGPSPNKISFSIAQQMEEEPSLKYIQTPKYAGNHKISPLFHGQLQGLLTPNDRQIYHQEEGPMASINEVIGLYSEEGSVAERDDDFHSEVQTPPHQAKMKEQVNSTGCKSLNGKVVEVKKSRPKDKGLRGLSSRAFKVVMELKETTYKDVALRLIRQLTLENQLEGPTEETNIKRRVYDALNVLIAVGILEKSGKSILVRARNKGQLIGHLDKELKTSFREFINAENRVRQRKEQLQQARMKMKRIKQLVQRNKQTKKPIDPKAACLPFPFIVVETHFNIKEVRCSPGEVQIQFGEMVNLLGDMDILRHLLT